MASIMDKDHLKLALHLPDSEVSVKFNNTLGNLHSSSDSESQIFQKKEHNIWNQEPNHRTWENSTCLVCLYQLGEAASALDMTERL